MKAVRITPNDGSDPFWCRDITQGPGYTHAPEVLFDDEENLDNFCGFWSDEHDGVATVEDAEIAAVHQSLARRAEGEALSDAAHSAAEGEETGEAYRHEATPAAKGTKMFGVWVEWDDGREGWYTTCVKSNWEEILVPVFAPFDEDLVECRVFLNNQENVRSATIRPVTIPDWEGEE